MTQRKPRRYEGKSWLKEHVALSEHVSLGENGKGDKMTLSIELPIEYVIELIDRECAPGGMLAGYSRELTLKDRAWLEKHVCLPKDLCSGRVSLDIDLPIEYVIERIDDLGRSWCLPRRRPRKARKTSSRDRD